MEGPHANEGAALDMELDVCCMLYGMFFWWIPVSLGKQPCGSASFHWSGCQCATGKAGSI